MKVFIKFFLHLKGLPLFSWRFLYLVTIDSFSFMIRFSNIVIILSEFNTIKKGGRGRVYKALVSYYNDF